MPRVTIYISDAVFDRVRKRGMENISKVCQDALRAELDRVEGEIPLRPRCDYEQCPQHTELVRDAMSLNRHRYCSPDCKTAQLKLKATRRRAARRESSSAV